MPQFCFLAWPCRPLPLPDCRCACRGAAGGGAGSARHFHGSRLRLENQRGAWRRRQRRQAGIHRAAGGPRQPVEPAGGLQLRPASAHTRVRMACPPSGRLWPTPAARISLCPLTATRCSCEPSFPAWHCQNVKTLPAPPAGPGGPPVRSVQPARRCGVGSLPARQRAQRHLPAELDGHRGHAAVGPGCLGPAGRLAMTARWRVSLETRSVEQHSSGPLPRHVLAMHYAILQLGFTACLLSRIERMSRFTHVWWSHHAVLPAVLRTVPIRSARNVLQCTWMVGMVDARCLRGDKGTQPDTKNFPSPECPPAHRYAQIVARMKACCRGSVAATAA